MSPRPIGYYVHHQGEGHRRRAVAIASAAPGRFTLIGTGLEGLKGDFEVLDIPDDRLEGGAVDGPGGAFDGDDAAIERPETLHYAPYDHSGIRERALAITGWIAERRPGLMVVDVSVEIAMLARLCATPTVYVRLSGDRTDPAHLDAFRGARALLAPFDERLDDPAVPDWVRARTTYLGGIVAAPERASPRDNVVVAAFGRGGARAGASDVAAAAKATPDHEWRLIGAVAAPDVLPANLSVLGWVDRPEREIARAGIVVAGAGDGVLGAVAAAARPYVCIPEARAYGEQAAKAGALERMGAAVVEPSWPAPSAWPDVLRRARMLDAGRVGSLHDPSGPAKAAEFLTRCADR